MFEGSDPPSSATMAGNVPSWAVLSGQTAGLCGVQGIRTNTLRKKPLIMSRNESVIVSKGRYRDNPFATCLLVDNEPSFSTLQSVSHHKAPPKEKVALHLSVVLHAMLIAQLYRSKKQPLHHVQAV